MKQIHSLTLSAVLLFGTIFLTSCRQEINKQIISLEDVSHTLGDHKLLLIYPIGQSEVASGPDLISISTNGEIHSSEGSVRLYYSEKLSQLTGYSAHITVIEPPRNVLNRFSEFTSKHLFLFGLLFNDKGNVVYFFP